MATLLFASHRASATSLKRCFAAPRAFAILVSLASGVVLAAPSSPPSRVPIPATAAAPAGTHGYPFPNTMEALAESGYLQEDVFLEGTARSFVPTSAWANVKNGQWDAAPTGPTAPYAIRLLIRRPADSAKFNGTVLVEWLNVSAGYDSDSFDSFGKPFMRDGYAYVGVSAQAGGINHLKKWDGARYGSLDHPGDSYSYDIFSQAGRALRNGSLSILGNLTPKIRSLVAWGGSQSGSRLFTYINAVDPSAQVFDGFVPFITAGGAPLSQAPLAPVTPPSGAAAVLRTDLRVPVLFQLSESEFINAARGVHQQPDSPRLRVWEYTGTSHANRVGVEGTMRRLQANGVPTGVFPECGDPPINDLSVFPVYRATLVAMHKWLQGTPPARAPRVTMDIPTDPSQRATIRRDANTGIALGGIRLPAIAVPLRTYVGTRPAAVLKQFPNCALFGAVSNWNGSAGGWKADPALRLTGPTEPSAEALYGSRANYVRTFRRSSRDAVGKGFLLRDDAAALEAQAFAELTLP